MWLKVTPVHYTIALIFTTDDNKLMNLITYWICRMILHKLYCFLFDKDISQKDEILCIGEIKTLLITVFISLTKVIYYEKCMLVTKIHKFKLKLYSNFWRNFGHWLHYQMTYIFHKTHYSPKRFRFNAEILLK